MRSRRDHLARRPRRGRRRLAVLATTLTIVGVGVGTGVAGAAPGYQPGPAPTVGYALPSAPTAGIDASWWSILLSPPTTPSASHPVTPAAPANPSIATSPAPGGAPAGAPAANAPEVPGWGNRWTEPTSTSGWGNRWTDPQASAWGNRWTGNDW
jgi:hypothetical protein